MTGTILKKSLQRFGIKPKSRKCKCNKHARMMDEKGPQWCEENKTRILKWLRIEAIRGGYPFSQRLAMLLINRAIKKAKQIEE